jgi:hypothetical protein
MDPRFGGAAQLIVKAAEVTEIRGNLGVLHSSHLLTNGEHFLVKRLDLRVSALKIKRSREPTAKARIGHCSLVAA